MEKLRQNFVEINQRIKQAALRSGRNPADIKLLAVSKTVDPETVLQAYQLGINDFGENRTQQLNIKQSSLPEARWHLIGHLQTNKIKDVFGKTYLIHSLDRWKLAEEINKTGLAMNIETDVLLQVNISGEEQKYGLAPDEVRSFLAAVGQLEMVKIKGFMTMAPLDAKPGEARNIFRELRNIRQEMLKQAFEHCDLKYLSMGMSQDFEVAIEEGANIVRIGSSLFNT
ncbi:MAG TPA: YggS family pyridoxal phosphate-dependent enzyme [Syntrophomonadaceae bacterium]|nr:YggS family pyridoxal phosphate-dependent enzyme [Syntrophomonadaceae bacterium]HNX29161.1 YggS family pyridoxal phosphate-dependent enzyme [Syntrophomonadaceae bacterium]HPR93666.1 YggS family pyridoxal phosphate-dependent enzyme [Syntrophomonadaceae bacterium]